MDKGGDQGPAANSSSDFVRKLYNMLEDPSYAKIVRWGEGGESFVVLENERFTKQILPMHFKHSNFASFVRQLNKYDFHKVRYNNDDSTQSPYGQNAWEFKHPDFQANKKDSLDSIKRKAPAPRKTTQNMEDQGFPSQQMDLVNSQLMATQQQLEQLSERYQDLAQGHVTLLQQVVHLQKFIKNHEGVMHLVLGFLRSVNATQRRSSRIGAGPFDGLPNDGVMDDHPASPLQQASELLEKFSAASLPEKHLEQMSHEFHLIHDYSTPPNDHPGAPMAPHAENTSSNMGYPVANDLDNMVYPVGHTNGIDPINSEHINNIPYSLPANGMMNTNPMPDMLPEEMPNILSEGGQAGQASGRRKTNPQDCVWGVQKPRIMLVEDDRVCADIGSRFLEAFGCGVETACDGMEAVNKLNHAGTQVDLILMDIIMPNLDGVSATVCIREMRPQIPVIAMTSNIRADDIDMYFRYGMNDVLPKPFTKEGMLRALEKHLPSFKKDAAFPPTGRPQMTHPGFATPNNSVQTPLGPKMEQLSATQSLKGDASPGKSPVTASSWHSPSQRPGPSQIGGAPSVYMQPMGDDRQYNMATAQPRPQAGFPPPPNPAMGQVQVQGQVQGQIQQAHGQPGPGVRRRGISDLGGDTENHPEKRQRIYGAGTGFPQ